MSRGAGGQSLLDHGNFHGRIADRGDHYDQRRAKRLLPLALQCLLGDRPMTATHVLCQQISEARAPCALNDDEAPRPQTPVVRCAHRARKNERQGTLIRRGLDQRFGGASL